MTAFDIISSEVITGIIISQRLTIMAMPVARAVRSYCTGISHKAGIRSHPIANFVVIDVCAYKPMHQKGPVTDVTWFRIQRAGPVLLSIVLVKRKRCC
ncbi:hypothetical protein HYN43_027185 [Mucilaginibacter celer]|uniref:Uncharacterized protein n=1 Tax=Mucilaginibacter celer TaxID=2305508 RepID=A0A494VZ18_9SPHI|nr:hypothetical protein HYN43_027185 [Mucilaginibacter celer]